MLFLVTRTRLLIPATGAQNNANTLIVPGIIPGAHHDKDGTGENRKTEYRMTRSN